MICDKIKQICIRIYYGTGSGGSKSTLSLQHDGGPFICKPLPYKKHQGFRNLQIG